NPGCGNPQKQSVAGDSTVLPRPAAPWRSPFRWRRIFAFPAAPVSGSIGANKTRNDGQMGRVFRALALSILVAGCGSGNVSAPRDLENACSIVTERPKYLRAMRSAERRWGVPVPVQMATIYQESKFVGNARTQHKWVLGVIPMGRQSSAYGYSQALDATWEEYKKSTGRRGAQRDDIEDATDFMGWYMDQSAKRLGIPKRDARAQYLAYHEGHTGYARGSYNNKAWLVRVAGEVGARSEIYAAQLANCRRAR